MIEEFLFDFIYLFLTGEIPFSELWNIIIYDNISEIPDTPCLK